MDKWRRADLRILDAIGAAIVVTDLSGTVTYWNAAAEALLGWSADEVLGEPVRAFLGSSPSRADDVRAIVDAVTAGGSWSGEWTLQNRVGEPVHVRVTDTPLWDDEGRVVGIVGASMCIAGEVEARRALEASERRFRALVSHAADGIAVVDADGLLSYVSPAVIDVLGRPEAEVIGRRALDFVEPLDVPELQAEIGRVRPGQEIGPIELKLRTAGGALLDFEGFRTDRLDDPDVAGIVWNLHDVSATREALRSLARSEDRLHALASGSSDVTAVVDELGTILYLGPSAERVFGYRPNELTGTNGFDLVHVDDLEGLESDQAAMFGAVEYARPVRYRLRHADGEWRWVEALFTNLLHNPSVGGLVANMRDVTDQHLAAEALRKSELRFRSIIETAEEGIWIHDVDGRTTFANPKMAAHLATTVEELEHASLFDFVDPADHAFMASHIERQHGGLREQYEFMFRKADGTVLDALISASPLPDDDGNLIGLLQMVTDIGDRKRAEAENARLTLEDSLTGLASRALVLDRINQVLARHTRMDGLAAVLSIDFDQFKKVNDSFGHDAGDRLLRHTAERIRGAVRPQDTVGRLGGDEFVVVLDGIEDVNGAISAAERISACLREPVEINGTVISTTASIGIALTPADDAASVLQDADTAMSRAKERGGARHELFDASLRERAQARLELERDLRTAIDQEQFLVHYQPVVDLAGHLVGLEALARWTHPTRGNISPGEFIPLAESTGLIVDLGAWILDRSCRDVARWRAQSRHRDLTVAVNLSGRQLTESGVAETVSRTLARHELDASALCLEITESVLMDDTVAATTALTAIHNLGVRLAVDDFGTGYSSLLYLRRFPVDALKLDRFFVAGIDKNPQDAAIVRAVIELAHSLGLVAVAEGVETAGQLHTLRGMHCDVAQGFYWSPGVPADALEALLARDTLEPERPTTVPAMSVAAGATEGAAPPAELGPRTSVLLVDDSDGERRLLFHHLEASGWFRVVGEAADGHAAVALAERSRPDLVVLDMSMPGMDGLETLSHLLRASPLTRVVVLSGFVSSGLRASALSSGAVAVLEKGEPFDSIVEQLRAVAAPFAAEGQAQYDPA